MKNISKRKNLDMGRSRFVIVLLFMSGIIMIISLTLIILIKFGIILQQPVNSSWSMNYYETHEVLWNEENF